MATVSELKEKAREYEQRGELDQALKIYQHILKHFEDSPGLIKVLPLYVKVGDLHLREGRPEAAVSAYETAAAEYAIHGAAQRVDALCSKIERADSSRADAHARLAQKLIDHGHAGAARDVLAAYAEAKHLTEVQESLDQLAGRPLDEVEPFLIRLLSSWGDGAAAPPVQAAARLSSQIQAVTDEEAGDLAPEPLEAEDDETASAVPPTPDAPPRPHHSEDQPSTLATVAPVTEPVDATPQPLPERASQPGLTETGPRITPFDGPSGPIGVGVTPPPARFNTPVLIGALVLGGIGGFVAGRFSAPDAATPTAAPVQAANQSAPPLPAATPPAIPDSTADSQQFAIDSLVDTALALTDSPADSSAVGPDSLPAAAGTDSQATVASDPAEPPPDPVPPTTTAGAEPEPADPPPMTPIVVAGLEVLSVADAELRGQTGFRVVHRLDDTGAELTVESYADTTGTASGRITVLVTEPDTVVGIVRMEGRIVYASGVMPEDSLRALMARLRVRPGT